MLKLYCRFCIMIVLKWSILSNVFLLKLYEKLKVTFFSLHDLLDNHRSYRSDVRLEYRVECGFSGEFGHGKAVV